jgi:hypothetical protein
MMLVPPEAPDHARVIVSLEYVEGLAVTDVGGVGAVFLRTEFVDTFQPE